MIQRFQFSLGLIQLVLSVLFFYWAFQLFKDPSYKGFAGIACGLLLLLTGLPLIRKR